MRPPVIGGFLIHLYSSFLLNPLPHDPILPSLRIACTKRRYVIICQTTITIGLKIAIGRNVTTTRNATANVTAIHAIIRSHPALYSLMQTPISSKCPRLIKPTNHKP
jgi:hypothetical protein